QGGNADIIKYFMLLLDEWAESEGDVVHLLMTVHDAFQWQRPNTPEGEAKSAYMLREMIRVQEPPFNLLIPFAVDHGNGPDWGVATFGEKMYQENEDAT